MLCRRFLAIGVAEALVAPRGRRSISVTLPASLPGKRAAAEMGATGRLALYDWEPSLIGREHAIGGHPGREPLGGPLRRAELEWRRAGRPPGPKTRPLIYAGAFPTARRARELAARRDPRAAIVSEPAEGQNGGFIRGAHPGWYALSGAPALTGAQITDPEATERGTGGPALIFYFTASGRRAFRTVTREIARRGRREAVGPVTPEAAEQVSGHFAVVVDDEVKIRPIVNFRENPNGIDGRTGAQITGGLSFSELRELAAVLRFGPLPVPLKLVLSRSAG